MDGVYKFNLNIICTFEGGATLLNFSGWIRKSNNAWQSVG